MVHLLYVLETVTASMANATNTSAAATKGSLAPNVTSQDVSDGEVPFCIRTLNAAIPITSVQYNICTVNYLRNRDIYQIIKVALSG